MVGFNAARGFVGGAAERGFYHGYDQALFQCRTRLCGWCSEQYEVDWPIEGLFQCRTRLCGWCSKILVLAVERTLVVSMPHAALWVVQLLSCGSNPSNNNCFNAARGFVGGAAANSVLIFHVSKVSMPHAALWVVQPKRNFFSFFPIPGFNAARGFVGGAAAEGRVSHDR